MKKGMIFLVSAGVVAVQGVLALITSVTGVLYRVSTLSSILNNL